MAQASFEPETSRVLRSAVAPHWLSCVLACIDKQWYSLPVMARSINHADRILLERHNIFQVQVALSLLLL